MATLTQPQPAMPSAPNPAAHPFTCNTCQVAFRSSDLQRTHMQSDWHRYNLKRRVASLPPLTSEVFAEKVLANKATAAATAQKAAFEKRCEACEKNFFSEGAYANHLGSHKHRVMAAKSQANGGNDTESMTGSSFSLGEPMETASSTASTVTVKDGVDEAEAEEELDQVVDGMKKSGLGENEDVESKRPSRPTPSAAAQANGTKDGEEMREDPEYVHKADLKQCLFCNYTSPSLDLNLNHMQRQHTFFIPEKEFLVDVEGLINYLSETIEALHQCLYCHKTVHTKTGVQTHMRDRGHCMIAYSTEEEQMEVGQFYDFRSTYSDEETEDEDEDEVEGGVKLGVKRGVKTTYEGEDGEDVDMDEDDEGWESDSTLSSVPTDEITSVPMEHRDHQYAKLDKHRHHSHSDPRPHKHHDGFHSHAHHTPHAVYHDDYELHLPSGRTAGHRSLRTYYRQNLRNYPTPEERANQRMLEEANPDRHVSDNEGEPRASAGGYGTVTRGRQPRGQQPHSQAVTRANGGLGMMGASEPQKREAAKNEQRAAKRAQRAENRYRAGNERRANHQKHFRDELLQ
ncbi:hypothetical protein D0867_02946 [Hortaea werneckii]|uniref:C2H2-type domain-containing protein n=1 Tax=Hortaea werneckii TaxID=91943 RepID=A0A3M7A3N3_HORWE|nr:hypothetical protein D0867_02946 [Hortaea werneckii]